MKRPAPARWLQGFATFVDAARLVWRDRTLRRLAAGGALVHIAWLATVLLLLEGVSHGRLSALGPSLPRAVHVTVLALAVLFAIFGLPWIGPIASALQLRAAEHTRALLGKTAPPVRDLPWWTAAIGTEAVTIYRRAFVAGVPALALAAVLGEIVPSDRPIVRAMTGAIGVLTVLALSAVLSIEPSAVDRMRLLRARWAEISGYVVGSWLSTLFGTGPWLVTLLAVAAELFHDRVHGPAEWTTSVPSPPATAEPFVRIPPDFAARIARHYRKVSAELEWNARLPDDDMRYEYLALVSDRLGEQQIGALLPMDGNARVDTRATRYWLIRTFYAGAFDSRDLPRGGDEFAGPLPIPR
ncbi:MAG TPA: hypothetical protein VK509_10955 [Polyangiales bacterium]|nr:hypothetical protein [Polyangiales bacterium]